MTPQEFEYLKRAMEELEKPPAIWERAKILRTVSQITDRAASNYEQQCRERFDRIMDRKYQDLQNQKLVDILKQ